MDVDALLEERDEDQPSGEDLEYDPDFTELEIAAQPGEERQVGDEVLPAEDPDYKDVRTRAMGILERSHDLRAAIFLAEAELRLSGFTGFAAATRYLAGCLEQHWATCHPQLDEEDDDDPTMRVNAVRGLSDDRRILRGVRRAPLTASRMFGALTLRDIAVAKGEVTAPADMESIPDMSQVNAAFQDTEEDALAEIAEAAAQALADVQAISAAFDEHTPGMGPDLDPLIDLLKTANSHLRAATGADVEEEEAATGDEEDGAAGAAAPRPALGGGGGGGGGGAITSPTDVTNALDRIIGYYERHEPSSPLPILLVRAKKLVNADFLTIVRDMAPDGIDNVHLVGGISEEEEEYE